METGTQQSAVNKKLLALVGVVLALLMIAICYVAFLLIRSKLAPEPTQQQLAPQAVLLPTQAIPENPPAQYLPIVTNLEAAAPASAPAPAATAASTSNVWRFLSINKNDVGTFENVGDPSQRIAAKCKDPNRPAPEEGALYTLDDTGVLKPQEGRKKYQRFEPIQ